MLNMPYIVQENKALGLEIKLLYCLTEEQEACQNMTCIWMHM
jgi:hypothetical protein